MSTGDTPQPRVRAASVRSARPFGIWTALSYHALLLTPLLFKERIPPAAADSERLTPQRALDMLRNPLVCALVAALIATSLVMLCHNGLSELRLEELR